MKIAAPLHFAMPYRMAGSESVVHLMLKALIAAGHEVRVYVTDIPNAQSRVYDTVPLTVVRNITLAVGMMRAWQPDVVLAHHQHSAIAFRYGRRWGAKTVYLTHNDMDVNRIPLHLRPDLVVHNSRWVAESLKRFPTPHAEMVMHPPLDCERHHVSTTGDAITMINTNQHKGARIFYQLAERMPEQRFLAVRGGHGIQVNPKQRPSNLEFVAQTPNLVDVWKRTGLLLMPSIYESYGLVGIEAGCSGIPTIANPTPGLRESLGPTGQFVTWADDNLPEGYATKARADEWARPSSAHVHAWETAIRNTLEPDAYAEASKNAAQRSMDLCVETEQAMSEFVNTVATLC